MEERDYYKTIAQNGTAEFKDRGSRFIAHAYPVANTEDFKKYLQHLKKEHPKAVHHCFAYRLGTDGNNYRVSDDGEPAGTAGRPILGQIDSRELTNLTVIITRYFGGTLLGVPGLINAYKTTAGLALQVIPIITRQIEVRYALHFDYTRMNDIMLILKQHNCTVLSQEMQLFCSVATGIPKNRLTETLYKLNQVRGVDIKKIA